ncbi:TetR family transcriptional regulator [Dactylosporangium siamense]|uniref:TetR family transcriptional regulator n=1 Tax=Dactylosporangium siamense TaxID=685454 RepID=A0A919UCZ5_9ACTN|nr:TetR family transcriptional regulator [Dactylosporangium siamense]
MAGALKLFARDGYTRAALDAIAAEAGVSNRTIYNHFTDKADLFQAVIQDSTERVASTMVDIIDRHLTKVADLESDLIDFGVAWLGVLTSDLAPHFALIRQINAEQEHVPPAALQLWRRTGPQHTRHELAQRLRRIAERGDLAMDDPARAAGHLMLLISADNLADPRDLHDQRETRAMITAGVQAFLHGYARQIRR